MKKITRNFTLLEVIISISILLLITSVLTININDALNKYNFDNEYKIINSNFELYKKKAFTDQEDIYLKIYQDKKNTYFKVLNNKNSIQENYILNNVSYKFNKNIIEEVEVIITSTGNIFPKGEIIFYNLKVNKEKKLIL